MLLDLSEMTSLEGERLLLKIRSASLFWNKHIMAQPFPRRLFAGTATEAEVLGWGIEFYFFVKSANEYMARGVSRVDGFTTSLAELWKHYVEEAAHDALFYKGLLSCGIRAGDLERRPPLASTLALINHLYEASEQGPLEYASLFAVMQPFSEPQTAEDIEEKYEFLSASYPFARFLFSAFKEHDLIDAGLSHSKLLLEPLLIEYGKLDNRSLGRIFKTIEETANAFVVFYEGISRYYQKRRLVGYRQRPNATQGLYTS
jgi:hypothetical protein